MSRNLKRDTRSLIDRQACYLSFDVTRVHETTRTREDGTRTRDTYATGWTVHAGSKSTGSYPIFSVQRMYERNCITVSSAINYPSRSRQENVPVPRARLSFLHAPCLLRAISSGYVLLLLLEVLFDPPSG